MNALKELFRKTGRRFAVASEILDFLRQRKAYWLAPLVLILLAIAFLFFLASQPPVTPFVYTLF